MERATKAKQRTPLPATQKVNLYRPTITKDDVRQRAYDLYLKRGATPGDELGDWFRAERELQAN